MDILDNVSKLPFELKEIILKYLSIEVKMILTKKNYIKHYRIRIGKIPYYNSYIRYIIRNQHNFIFNLNIFYKGRDWFNLKGWRYDNKKYSNYLVYLKKYSENHSQSIYEKLKNIEINNEYL